MYARMASFSHSLFFIDQTKLQDYQLRQVVGQRYTIIIITVVIIPQITASCNRIIDVCNCE
jgi:hypothetical protein